MKYRKKPVVIEAMRITKDDLSLAEASGWMLGHGFNNFRINSQQRPYGIEIETLEGKMLASPGDWIIRGTHGEFYPIKAHIFEANYERATGIEQ